MRSANGKQFHSKIEYVTIIANSCLINKICGTSILNQWIENRRYYTAILNRSRAKQTMYTPTSYSCVVSRKYMTVISNECTGSQLFRVSIAVSVCKTHD